LSTFFPPKVEPADSFSFNRLWPAGKEGGGGSETESSEFGTARSSRSFFFGFGPRFLGTLTSPPVDGKAADVVGVCWVVGASVSFFDFFGGGFSCAKSRSNRKNLSWIVSEIHLITID